MENKIKIPLSNAGYYYDLLLQNERTNGTNEQKMLVLRRRFDRILRDVTGPFAHSTSFYSSSMDAIKRELDISDTNWTEYMRMKDSFNYLMHGDVDVSKSRYLQSLLRMANFVSLLSNEEIPLALNEVIGKKKKINIKETRIPVFCCISSTSITEKENRDQFNIAALKFRNELLSDIRIKNRIRFTFLVASEDGIVVRDMSDKPVSKATPTKTPRETALHFAAQELSRQENGMIILLYGGEKMKLNEGTIKSIKNLNPSIQIYPISLDQKNTTFTGFPYKGQVYQMIPGCYEEFFNWLYDSLILLYQ